jgi:hypothetical protein
MLHVPPCAMEPAHVLSAPLAGAATVQEFGVQICLLSAPPVLHVVDATSRLYPLLHARLQAAPYCSCPPVQVFHCAFAGSVPSGQYCATHVCVTDMLPSEHVASTCDFA